MAAGDLVYSKSVGDAGDLVHKTGSGALAYKKEVLTFTSRVGFNSAFYTTSDQFEDREYVASEVTTAMLDNPIQDWTQYNTINNTNNLRLNVQWDSDLVSGHWNTSGFAGLNIVRFNTSSHKGKTRTLFTIQMGISSNVDTFGATIRVGVVPSSSATPSSTLWWWEDSPYVTLADSDSNADIQVSGSVTLDDYLFITRYCYQSEMPAGQGYCTTRWKNWFPGWGEPGTAGVRIDCGW